MRVATFNANSIRSRLETVIAWTKQHQPDVFSIQETKVQDADFPMAPLIEAGYHVTFRGQKSYNGVAVLTRNKPDAVHFGLDDGGPADEPRLAWVRMGDVSIVNTYVPQGREVGHEMFRYKIEWFDRLRRFFDRHFRPSDQVIWVGDMNVAAEPIDVHNPEQRENHVCYHIDARNAFAACRAWGFVDVFRAFHPEPGHYTFFDYRARDTLGRNLGWRIDYIMATPAMASRARDSWIDLEPRRQSKPSDHTPLAADFE